MCAGPAVLALLTLVGAPVRADQPAAAGPFFGVHAGLGVPYGDIARGGPRVEDLVERKVPLGLEIGYRLDPRFWAELLFDVAPGSTASSLCAAGASCSASDVRLGVALLFRLAPRARLDPWLGVGIGIEVLNAKGYDATAAAPFEWSWFGYELPFAEAGMDVAVTDRIGVGPWVSATVARFTSDSVKPVGGTTVSGAIQRRATHGWLSGGLKATLKL